MTTTLQVNWFQKVQSFIVTLTNLMLPYLEYCVEVWGNTYETLLQLSRKL